MARSYCVLVNDIVAAEGMTLETAFVLVEALLSKNSDCPDMIVGVKEEDKAVIGEF